MLIRIIIFTLVVASAGCATLTKTQVKAVNQFAEASKNFSSYPASILTGLAAVRSRRGVYAANSIDNPALHVEELDNIYVFNSGSIALAEQVDLSCKILDKYAQSLLLLSSDKRITGLDEQSKSFGVSLDSLTKAYNRVQDVPQVPYGIGGAVGRLVALGGKQYIRVKQAKEIRKFVLQADTLVGVMTTNLLQFLKSSNMKDLISIEEKGVTASYLSFLRQVRTIYSSVAGDSAIIQSNSRAAISNDKEYLELKAGIDDVKTLQQQTTAATNALRKAHKKLLETVQHRITLTSALEEVMALQEEVKKVRLAFAKIESAKNKLP